MCFCLFITGYVLPLQEEQREETKKKISKFLTVYYDQKSKNMRIMFKKLYGTYSGGTTRMCFMQFLEHNLYIFAYKYSKYTCNETE